MSFARAYGQRGRVMRGGVYHEDGDGDGVARCGRYLGKGFSEDTPAKFKKQGATLCLKCVEAKKLRKKTRKVA